MTEKEGRIPMNDGATRSLVLFTASDSSDLSESRLTSSVDVLPVDGAMSPTSVRPIRVLGHGRAAEARLVEATDETGDSVICVEKIFHPGLLTRTIYRAAYQTSFAYQYNADAIRACFYRRRVAAAIVEAMIPEARVAKPLYVRWDKPTQALVLASEFINGRGIVPQDVDPQMLRRWLSERLSRTLPASPAEKKQEEINELLSLMTRLESLLIECGLTGSGWQVCKRAMVSTANLLKTDSGYVVVDLESGIPSVLVPVYVWQGIRLKSLPLFDDLDPDQLINWLAANSTQLHAALGDRKLQQLREDTASLIRHTTDWKLSEPAIARQPWRLISADFFKRFRSQVTERWHRCGITDEASNADLGASKRFFTRATFVLGLIPGKPGRLLQRIQANSAYRNEVRRWLVDREFRRTTCSRYAATKAAQWRSEERVASEFLCESISFGFLVHSVLARTTPATLHRWLVDPAVRKTQLTRAFLFCVSSRFQSEYGRMIIRSRIESWQRQHRLPDAVAKNLTNQLNSNAIEEYVRGFGLHVGLKLLLPIVMPLKVGGAAASLASGNPLYFLFMLMLVPILRTCVTIWRMIASRESFASFRQAMMVGLLPVVGSLAFPVQMSARFSELSLFLMRDFASRLGCALPIYGGKDSRTELMAIKLVNVVAEGLDVWLSFTKSKTTVITIETDAIYESESRLPLRMGRWDRMAVKHLELMQRLPVHSPNLPAESKEMQDNARERAA
jgi:hypothetical protein